VVTLGGGHGQAALLRGLSRLDCHITAIVSVADDGGCSGKLREELGMPPPGDVRRCLVSLATLREADQFEERLQGEREEGRCVGNLVLAEMSQDLGSLQRAVDWAGALLGCLGRVVPVADVAGTLNVYDLVHGPIVGEAAIERLSANTLVATVAGPERASPEALARVGCLDRPSPLKIERRVQRWGLVCRGKGSHPKEPLERQTRSRQPNTAVAPSDQTAPKVGSESCAVVGSTRATVTAKRRQRASRPCDWAA
jgi:hypothetical protein